MGRRRIPIAVIVIACLYLAVGIGGFVSHFSNRSEPDWIWVEVTELLAIVCGVFLPLAHKWARWLAVAWMAFHLVISFGDWGQMAGHTLFLVLIVWGLFRADTNQFFSKAQTA
jgi:uncharacterized membrane protein HdeD (DUF308 family)